MTNEELFRRVKKLSLPKGKYALFGSAPIGIRNLKECHDVDIIVTKDIFNEFKKKPNWKLEKMPHGDEFLSCNDLELWFNWKPGTWDIEKLIKEAEIIDDLPFVKLEYVIEWKKRLAREKDLKDVKTAEDYLKSQKEALKNEKPNK